MHHDKRRLEFELKISNNSRVLSTVEAFIREILRQTSLDEKGSSALIQLVVARVSDTIANAYPPGETGSILIHAIQDSIAVTVTIRDYGLPQDVHKLETDLHMSGKDRAAADELHWISYGPEGKALRITKWQHAIDITVHPDAGDLKPFHEKQPLAPEQEYEIRRLRPEEAVQVSQLMYKTYGSSYFNSDVYYPDRVAAMNEKGETLSFVAVGADGKLVGHYALERNQPGPVAEGGQAVVDPAHRGRKLLERMKTAGIEEAKRLGLVGMYGDAVTVHTFSQKTNIEHGAHLACANIGISPRSETFRGIGAETQPQRVTCLLYFLWLQPPPATTVFVPDHHREAVEKLYRNIGCPVNFGEEKPPEGMGEFSIKLDKRGATAFLRVNRIGQDTAVSIRHAKRSLTEQSHAEALFAELPLNQPALPALVRSLEKEGFSFAGITPHFNPDGDLLRMAYLTEPLSLDQIKIAEEIGRWLVGYALAEQARVNRDPDQAA
jgi:hypothetical protein